MTERASTARHFHVYVTINGESLGPFDRRTGGSTSATNATHTPGSAPAARVVLGGPRSTDDVTASRDFVGTRDHVLIQRYQPLCGLAEVSVSQVPLDKDGREFGTPNTWTGILQTIGPPDYDSGSTDVSKFDVVVTVDGDVG